MSDEHNPMQRAREHARPKLPKRFYKDVSVEPADGGWTVALDGRLLKTPGRQSLSVASKAIAAMIAAEWEAQAEEVDPSTMPVTRLVNTAIDGVAKVCAEVARDIARYACSDLVCYRAEGPQGLVDRQAEAWDDLVAWFADGHGMRLRLSQGVMPVEQDAEAAEALGGRLAGRSPLELAALHTLTSLAGSAVIALAVAQARLDAEAAWAAAHVDEDWQIAQWGEDTEAMNRRAMRWREFNAAAGVLAALGACGAG